MPDWTYDAAQWVVDWMESGNVSQTIAVLFVASLGLHAQVALHELAHAVAARARGIPVHGIHIGGRPRIFFHVGRTKVEVGWGQGDRDFTGHVRFDSARASPTDILVTALAGPVAGLSAGLALWWAAFNLGQNALETILVAWPALAMVISDLLSLTVRGQGDERTDRDFIALAWAARRARHRYFVPDSELVPAPDPVTPRSVGPPVGLGTPERDP